MAEAESDAMDPFRDSAQAPTDTLSESPENDALTLSRDVTLTLGAESLTIFDEALTLTRSRTCCGLLPGKRLPPTRTIPYFNILWTDILDLDLSIHYVRNISKDIVRVTQITYNIDKADRVTITRWIDRLRDLAYGQSQRHKRIKVLVNPYGGAGRAWRLWQQEIAPIFAAAQFTVNVEQTKYAGHAIEIAQHLDIDAYDVIAACSGDGLPYEVFNGFAKRADAGAALSKVAVVQLPCGTGNAMSHNLNGTDSPSLAALAVAKGIRMPLDLASITQGEKRILSFLSQAFGIIAEVDLGTEHLRWLGEARFTYGFFTRLLRKTCWPADIHLSVIDDDKAAIRRNHQLHMSSTAKADFTPSSTAAPTSEAGLPALCYGTINDPVPSNWQTINFDTLGNFYSGNMAYMAANMNFFQGALPSDGCLDLLCIDGNTSFTKAIGMLLAAGNSKLFDVPEVQYRKIDAYRLIPKPTGERAEEYIAIDGERIPCEPFQVEIHRGLGVTLSRSGRIYEAPPL